MRDKNIWVFNAGNAFSGNPKWLFEYVINNHPEIRCHWLCYNEELVTYMREHGFEASLYTSHEAETIGAKAGVYVVNQYKEQIQDYLVGATIVNLWHGVGCKTVEREVTSGFLHERIVKKHIMYREIYERYQLFLVTSPLMEKHFIKQCGIDDEMLIRAGYPCCTYPGTVQTFDHDILAAKGLSSSTKIAVYAPTYRDNAKAGFLIKAIPSIKRLIKTLEEKDLLLIFKMHPQMENDPQFLDLRHKYADHPRLLFWDNANDIYEIFDEIDLGIIDYSSIYYDMLAAGVPHFIRYFFDYDTEAMRDFVFDCREMTSGIECDSFDTLLKAISNYENDDQSDTERINDTFWMYATPDSCEKIVQRALTFKPRMDLELPTLHSFDIFDTLIARTTLQPTAAFRYVQHQIRNSGKGFPDYLVKSYTEARLLAERNVREYRDKTMFLHPEDRTEITFESIFNRLRELYDLNDEQVYLLKKWEIEAELRVSIPIEENISKVHYLVDAGETVILISDMYLPKEVVVQLLEKADPMLAKLPLFLSSDIGYQKTKKALYLKAFHSFDDYRFGKWVHTGDSMLPDVRRPRELGIIPTRYTGGVKMGEHAREFTINVPTFDAYQVGRIISRFENNKSASKQAIFAYCYASKYFVPYVHWAIYDALKRGTQTLYFISRDGYHLKRIADAIIDERKLPIKTKYIYGSRRAWRIPSQVHDVDEDFYSDHGSFAGIRSFEATVNASGLSEEEFLEMFPQLVYLKEKRTFEGAEANDIRGIIHDSVDYRKYILNRAAKERESICGYLAQEIDTTERFAFVEYWGRGYTQTCLSNLLNVVDPKIEGTEFYYARSIYPTEGKDIRHNLTSITRSLIFIESIFSNIPYKTVESFKKVDGRYEPVINPNDYNADIFDALEEYLPRFARDYARIDFIDPVGIARDMLDYGIVHFHENRVDPIYLENIAPLKDAMTTYGKRSEYAPEWTLADSFRRLSGMQINTSDRDMSLARSKPAFKLMFYGLQGAKRISKFLKPTKTTNAIKKVRDSYDRGMKNVVIPAVEERLYKETFPNAYLAQAEKCEVNPRKVVFLELLEDEMPDAFALLFDKLQNDYDFEVSYISLNRNHVPLALYYKNCLDAAKNLADAAYIFLADANDLVSCLPIREETYVTQLWHACGAFKMWGMSTADLSYGMNREELLNHPYYKNLDLVTVSSPEVEWAYREAMVLGDTPETVQPTGVSRTDVFFDQDFAAGARARVYEQVPEAEGKKILLYAPTYRGSAYKAEAPNVLELDVMKRRLGSEWVLLIKHHPLVHDLPEISEFSSDFAFDVSKSLNIEDLLICADACITDYSSIVFEYSLMERPMAFFAYDLDSYLGYRGFYYDYGDITPGPICFDTKTVTDYIANIDERFDRQEMRDFREKFMRSCDGHSTDRILERVFGDELEAHHK